MNLKFKNTILVILSLFTTVATAQTQANAIEAKKKILFNSSNTPSTPYRIPAIATMSNGEIIAIADYRPCGADVGNGDVDIYARISKDNGGSWSGTSTTYDDAQDVIKIADGGVTKTDLDKTSKGYGDAAVAADPSSGKIVVMSVGAGNTTYGNASTSTSDYLCIRHYSEDYGRTWTTHDDVTSYFKGSNNILGNSKVRAMFFGSGKLAVSKKVQGRIYGALLVRDGISSAKNYVVYSNDWGKTWKLLGNGAACTNTSPKPDEPKVEELPNGDILLSSRRNGSGGRYFNVFNFSNITNATGSWGNANSYSFAGSNSTNGEILLYRGVYKDGQTYDIMLQSLPTGSSRSNVSIYYKAFATDKSSWPVNDFTSGWTKGIEVDNGGSAYSTMTIMPNGEIGFLYEDDYDTSKADGDYSNITFVPLTVEEVTGGAYTAKAPVANPTFTISATSATLTAGETLKLATETNSDGTVSYSSSNTAVATVDATSGNVTAIAAGTATITASVPKTDKYNAASATCTITVKAATVDPDPEPEPEPEPTPETTSITITATSGEIASYAYYAATFSHEKAMTVSSGVKAYYVKASGEDAISLTQVPYGQAIPAGQGVLLISTNVSSMTLTEATENVASLTGNLLMPTLSQESVTFGANDYVLVKRNGEFVFAKASGSTVQNYKNHAYLRLNSNQANVRMIFDDNDATGINGIETDEQDAIYYDLMGRRVTNPTKGIYIKNGKKVLFR